MKHEPRILALLVLGVMAGCSTPPERQAWDVKPTVDVRHGMAEAKAYVQMGRYQQMQGRDAMAEDFYRRALTADPGNADALHALATVHAERGQLDRAAEIYRRLAEQGPSRAYLFNNIGYAYYLQGRYAEAIEALRTALNLDPAYERAWVNLERSARKAGQTEVLQMAMRRSLQAVDPVATAEMPAVSATASMPIVAAVPATPLVIAKALGEVQPAVPEIIQTVPQAEATPVIAAVQLPLAREAATQAGATLAPVAEPAKPPVVVVRKSVPEPALPEPIVKVTTRASVPPQAELPKARLDIANGNGVNGEASRARSQLRNDGLPVSRIFNYASFSVRQTFIEYRPGYAEAAKVLRDRLGRAFALKEVSDPRPAELRLVLGADWRQPKRVLSEAESELAPSS